MHYLAYVSIIDEDIEWIKKSKQQGIVSEHIIEVLKDSVLQHYGKTYENIKKPFNPREDMYS